jgi:Na+-driven multidrug efflux pump
MLTNKELQDSLLRNDQLQTDLLDGLSNGLGNSERDLELAGPLVAQEPLISYRTATRDAAGFAAPFVLTRLMTAIQNIGNGIAINALNSPAATAASPVMFMIQQSITGTARGALSSVNAVIGNLNGQMKYNQIGPAVNQGLLLGTLLGIPTTALFFMSPAWLEVFGLENEVAQQAGEYLRSLSYGIIPSYLTVVDQSFLLSIKRKRSPLLLNTLLVSTSMAAGFPLGIYYNNLAWLGYSVSAASLLTFAVGRGYLFLNKVDGILDREKYNLFTKSFISGTPFKELLGLSLPTALQAISEWLPTMLIAILSAKGANAESTLESEEPSMQTLVILNQVLLALGTAATVSVSNALGRAIACAEKNDSINQNIWKKNARTAGFANLIITTMAILPPALFCAIYPTPIIKLFSNEESAYPLGETMLRITGGTLVIDGIRNTATGALLGKKRRQDNYFTSITNLAITSAAAITLGYFVEEELGPVSFFMFRMIAISITAALLLHRWNYGSKVEDTLSNTVPVYSESVAASNTLFGSSSARTKQTAHLSLIENDDELELNLPESNGSFSR